MFIGIIEKENAIEAKTYYNHEEWHKDTFCPLYHYWTIEFKIKGSSYAERKEHLRNIAIAYSNIAGELNLYWSELFNIQNFFEKNGKRYGLLNELKENAIC